MNPEDIPEICKVVKIQPFQRVPWVSGLPLIHTVTWRSIPPHRSNPSWLCWITTAFSKHAEYFRPLSLSLCSLLSLWRLFPVPTQPSLSLPVPHLPPRWAWSYAVFSQSHLPPDPSKSQLRCLRPTESDLTLPRYQVLPILSAPFFGVTWHFLHFNKTFYA